MSEQTRYPITCPKCGATDTVPFKPDPNRGQLYCRKCYREMRTKRET